MGSKFSEKKLGRPNCITVDSCNLKDQNETTYLRNLFET